MITVKGLSKTYPGGIVALRDVDLHVGKGEFLVILGPSGAGKSTLMRCINRLAEPSSGEVWIDGRLVTTKPRELREIRQRIGMVFQQFNLVKRLSVLTNVLCGRLARHHPVRALAFSFGRREKLIALECLARVGLEHKAFQRADTLSGGEQQRVAIARALAQEPKVILADEPVASLDPKIARSVLTYLKQIASELGITALCNLHQVEYAREFGERIVALSQGRLVFDGWVSDLTDEVLRGIYDSDRPIDGGG